MYCFIKNKRHSRPIVIFLSSGKCMGDYDNRRAAHEIRTKIKSITHNYCLFLFALDCFASLEVNLNKINFLNDAPTNSSISQPTVFNQIK